MEDDRRDHGTSAIYKDDNFAQYPTITHLLQNTTIDVSTLITST